MAKLYFYYSAMNAGKSTNLLQSNHNYRERGMDTMLFTPSFDDRFQVGKIHSRIGLSADATTFDVDDNFFEIVAAKHPKPRCVLIDEAQFISKDQVAQLAEIVDSLNIPVLAFGLRSDYRGDTFEGSQYLLAWAEELCEIKTICHCGSKATMNARIDEHGNMIKEGDQVFIGGNDDFVATCRKCFKSGNLGKLKTDLARKTEEIA